MHLVDTLGLAARHKNCHVRGVIPILLERPWPKSIRGRVSHLGLTFPRSTLARLNTLLKAILTLVDETLALVMPRALKATTV